MIKMTLIRREHPVERGMYTSMIKAPTAVAAALRNPLNR